MEVLEMLLNYMEYQNTIFKKHICPICSRPIEYMRSTIEDGWIFLPCTHTYLEGGNMLNKLHTNGMWWKLGDSCGT